MPRSSASLTADLIRRGPAAMTDPNASPARRTRLSDDLKLLLFAYVAGFVAFLLFIA